VTWVAWRRQRTETLIAAGIFAALALALVPTGIEMASAYHHDGLSACLGANTSFSCSNAVESFTSRFDRLNNFVSWLTLLPGLFGVLLAAPFVLELENGTYRLAWTQSITRRRWIVQKLGVAVGVAVIVALALILLVTWWRTPYVHLQGRMDSSVYDSEGIVVFGYTLFALGLATAIGVVWRRAVPALVTGFAGYFVARIFVDTWLRQRLLTPLKVSWPFANPEPAVLQHAWSISQQIVGGAGQSLPKPAAMCGAPSPKVFDKAHIASCFARHGVHMQALYLPASRFWPLQGIETGMFAGTALVLLLFAAWWTSARAA